MKVVMTEKLRKTAHVSPQSDIHCYGGASYLVTTYLTTDYKAKKGGTCPAIQSNRDRWIFAVRNFCCSGFLSQGPYAA